MAEHQLDKTPDDVQKDAPQKQKEPGPGALALQAMLAKGRPEPKAVVELIDAHRSEHDDMMKLLHTTMGNAYVQEVLAAMDKLRLSVPRKELVAGDPNNPNAGYFQASAEQKGAKWSTAGGGFTGTADQKGLDSTVKLDDANNVHATVDAKKKEGAVALMHNGVNEGELYGKKNDDGWEAGSRRSTEVDGATVTASARHQVKDGVGNDGVAVDYEKDKTTASAMVGVSQGKTVASAEGSHEFAGGSKVHGSIEKGADGVSGGVDGTYQLDKDRKLTGSYEHTAGDKGAVDTFKGGYAAPNTSVDGSLVRHEDGHLTGALTGQHSFGDKGDVHGGVTRNDASTDFALGGKYNLGVHDQLTGELKHTQPDAGQGQTTLNLHQAHNGSRLIESADFELGTGKRDYAKAHAGLDLQLAPNFYAGAFGDVTAERGKDTQASLGASLTFTPNEKLALTAAGIMNNHGGFEGRLQLDVFKDKLNGLSDISQHKKDAIVSAFISVSGGGAQPGMLNDRMGAPNMGMDLGPTGRETRVGAGLIFHF
jgi:hypothetical protein